MSSLVPATKQADSDTLNPPVGNNFSASNLLPAAERRMPYPGGPRRVSSVNSMESIMAGDRDTHCVASYTLPVFSGQPPKRPLEVESSTSGNHGPCRSLVNSPKRAAFEEWLVKACLEASRPQPEADSTKLKPAVGVPRTSGQLEAMILKACLEEAGPQKPGVTDSWHATAASQEGSCRTARKTSPVQSVSDVSMDAFAVNSSDNSDAYSTAGSSAEIASEPESEPPSTRKLSDPGKATEPSEHSEDISSTPLRRTRPEVDRKGGLTIASFASALMYPIMAATAAANTAFETLGCALAIFEDEEWGRSSQPPHTSPENGYSSEDSLNGFGDMFPKAKERPQIQAILPGKVGLRGRLQGFERIQAQQQSRQSMRRGESWEEVLQKRRAAKAFAKFLEQARGKLVANRLYIPDQDGTKVPLWRRRGFSQLGSIMLAHRKGAVKPLNLLGQKNSSSQRMVEAQPVGTPSPLWQRRAVGPPTPLTMARRKVPQQVPPQVGVRSAQVPGLRAH